MTARNDSKATFAEFFGSIKFSGKRSTAPARPWPAIGFAVNKSCYMGEAPADYLVDDSKLVRSSN